MTMDAASQALLELGHALQRDGYSFVTVSPETHRRVNARAEQAGKTLARTTRDAFGWNRPFDEDALPAHVVELARAADVIAADGPHLRARVRFSTLHGRLFVHSAYPTEASDAVFFGPDTYRFCDLVVRHGGSADVVVDVGCGTGAGGIVAADRARHVVLSDVNGCALRLAAVNAALAGVAGKVVTVASDVLASVDGPIDFVIANPPYMRDGKGRAYRDGGGERGEALGVRIAREALARLAPSGRLVLYTGSAIVGGRDAFGEAVSRLCEEAGAEYKYRELDPDVFGEEIEQNPAYADVERIAAVALVAVTPGPRARRATCTEQTS